MSPSSRRWTVPLLAIALGGSAFAAGLQPLGSRSASRTSSTQDPRIQGVSQRLAQRRAALGLNDLHSFAFRSATTDKLGQLHARFDQQFRGIPIFGAQLITHTTPMGVDLDDTDATVKTVIKANPTPSVDSASAISTVREMMKIKTDFTSPPTVKLVWWPRTIQVPNPHRAPGKAVNAVDMVQQVVGWNLAYDIHAEKIDSLDAREAEYIVDAHNGTVIKHWNALQTAAGIGNTQYSGQVPLQTSAWNGTFIPLDPTRGVDSYFTGFKGNMTVDMADGTSSMYLITSDNNVFGDGTQYVRFDDTTTPNGQTAAADAAWGLEKTWDYYKNIHGRSGIDGFGTSTINRVHYLPAAYPGGYDNAFWNDSCFCMTFGDGSGPENGGLNTVTEIDVDGHEMSHGVTAATAGLIYDGESGGLNEANSDIHGTMVEFYASAGGTGSTIPNTGGNFTIGEQLAPSPLRWMYKPSLDGVSRDAWSPDLGNLDVHYSSGPMNRAFYFLSQGAHPVSANDDYTSTFLPDGMTGIGNDHAARIWYRALTVYMTPTSNYVAARTAALRSAADLYGQQSAEYRAVENAFAAINVGYSAGTFDDVEAPTAQAVSVSGNSGLVTALATASDNVGVTQVDFYVDDVPVGSAYTRPFTVSIDTRTVTNGQHQLDVVAYDAAGNDAVGSPSVSFQVNNVGEELLTNGGFEQGSAGWTTTPQVINYPEPSNAHRGVGYAWLDGYGSVHSDSISQVVSIPQGAKSAALTFYGWFVSAETDGTIHDTLTVTVRNPSDNSVLATLATYSNLDGFPGWVQRSFDLTAYAGQNVRIQFDGVEDATNASNWLLDDISVHETADDTTNTAESTPWLVDLGAPYMALGTDAFDYANITSVEFLVDGNQVANQTHLFGTVYDTTPLAPGSHQLVTVVHDAFGNTTASAPLDFFIDGTQTDLIQNGSFTTGGTDVSTTGPGLAPPWGVQAAQFQVGTRYGNGFRTNYWPDQNDPDDAAGSAREAVLGNFYAADDSSLYQDVTLPAGIKNAVLSFDLSMITNAADATGWVEVHVTDPVSGEELEPTLLRVDNTDDTVYTGAFATRTVRLRNIGVYAAAHPVIRIKFVNHEGPNTLERATIDHVQLIASSTPDTNAPTVTVSAQGTYGNILLIAQATDDLGVRSVEFFVDGASVGVANQEPWVMGWSGADGVHTVIARASDTSGNVTDSAPFSFTVTAPVADTTAPTFVSVTATGEFEHTDLNAVASDNQAVTWIELLVDGQFVQRCDGNVCSATYDSSALTAGPHTLTARAADGWNNVTTSTATFNHQPVSVTLAPVGAVLYLAGTQDFTATVTSDEPSATYSIDEGAAGGTIDGQGHYTAPGARGQFHVRATSVSTPSVSGTALVTVYSTDTNDDGTVDAEDMANMAAAYGTTSPAPVVDLNRDSQVDDQDVNLFNAHFE